MDTKAAARAFYKLFSIILLVSLLLSSVGTSAPSTVRAQEATTEPPPVDPTGTPTVEVATPEVGRTPTVEFATKEVVPTASETVAAPPETPTAAGTPEAALGSPTATEEIISIAPAPMLILNPETEYVIAGESLQVDWIIDGVDPAKQDLTVKTVLVEGFEPAVGAGQSYDSTTRTLTTPAGDKAGTVQLEEAATGARSAALEASLYDGETVLAKAYLTLPVWERFSMQKGGGSVAAQDGTVKVTFPEGVLPEEADILIGAPKAGSLPEGSLSGSPFSVEAHGKDSATKLQEFGGKVELEVSYAGIQVPVGAGTGDIFVYWFDPDSRTWVALESWVDTKSLVVHATTDHFTDFDIGLNDWRASRLPAMPGFQGPSFTGAATYSVPIELPPGPGGWAPSLELTYNSQVVDAATTSMQASWVGMGWTLSESFISIDTHGTKDYKPDDTFLVTMNGATERLAKSSYSFLFWEETDDDFWTYEWEAEQARWIARDKVGNTFYFEDVARLWTAVENGVHEHRWSLTRAQNIFGQEITYTYDHETDEPNHSTDTAVYPATILYANGRYRVRFEREDRKDYDTAWILGTAGKLHERQRLKSIYVEHDPSGTGDFETIRRYDLSYAPDSNSPGMSNLAAWWSMDETGGTRVDSNLANDLADNNTVGYSTAGLQGNAAEFIRVNGEFLSAVDTADISMGNIDFSVVANVYLNSTPGDMVIAFKGNKADLSKQELQLSYVSTTQKFRLRVSNGAAAYAYVDSADAVSSSQWYTVIAWYDSVADKLYMQVNGGTPNSTDYASGSYNSTYALTLGANADGTSALDGRLDEVALYKRVLTAEERAWLFDGGAGRSFGDMDISASTAIFPGHTYTAGGRVNTLTSIQMFDASEEVSLPPTSFLYGDHMHLTRAENGYGGAVEYAYTEPYFPDDANEAHTLHLQGCPGMWEARPYIGWVFCPDLTTNLIGFAHATRSTRDFLRPGGTYKITSELTPETASYAVGISDGTTDHFVGGTSAVITLPATASRADALAWAGGTQAVEVDNYKLRLLPSVYRVASRTVFDGGDGEDTFTYAYEGAAFNDATNSAYTCPPHSANDCFFQILSEFRGHSFVTETDPGGRITEVTYLQDDIYKGRPSSVAVKSDPDTELEETLYTYDATSVGAGWPDYKHNWIHLESAEHRIYDNNGAFVATRTDYNYGSYGNQIEAAESEWNGSGWNLYRTTTTDYFPNVTSGDYLVGLPARSQVKSATGTVLSESLILYDAATTYNTAPTVGELRATRTKVDATDYSQTSILHDTWGNTTTVTTYSGYGTASTAPTTGARTTYTCFGGGGTLDNTACADDGYHTYPLWGKNAAGHVSHFEYDYRQSVPISELDPNGNTTSATYDAFGRIRTLTRPPDTSATLQFEYDPDPQYPFTTEITQRVDMDQSFTMVRQYDGLGRQTSQDAGGVITDFKYDAHLRMNSQSAPYRPTATPTESAQFTDTTYDLLGRPDTVTAPGGITTDYSYDGLSTTQTDARDYTTMTLSDVWGRVTSVTPPSGPDYGQDASAKALLHTNGSDGATTFSDESGKTWTRTGNAQIDTAQAKFGGASGLFDGSGDYVSTNDHADFEPGSGNFSIDFYVRFTGTIAGQPLFNKMKPPGAGGPYQYWASMPNANLLQFVYSTNGTALSYVNFTWSPAVDTWYHVELTRNGSSMYLFVNGTQTGGTQSITGTIHDGDPQLQVGNIWSWNYLNGWIDEFRFSKGVARHTSNFTPPSREYSGLSTSPGVTYEYDQLDRLTVVERGGLSTNLYYDNAGRKTSMTDPDMGEWDYEYDALGNLTSQTDARSCVLALGYDSLNRLTGKSSSGSGCGTQVSTAYGYDSGTNGIGHRTSMDDAPGWSSWTFDERGRLSSESKGFDGGETFVTGWAYNSADLLTTLTYPGGEAVDIAYDNRMLLNTLGSTVSEYVTGTTYDSAGRVKTRALDNGLTQTLGYYGWAEKVNDIGQGGRLHTLTTGSVQNLAYTYDKSGNITQLVDSHASETNTYAYDGLGRLSDWTLTGGIAESYIYDPTSGNLASKAGVGYKYEDAAHAHAATGLGANSYSYDANGNMTCRSVGAGIFNLIYDAENRLSKVQKLTQGPCPAANTEATQHVSDTFTFSYDGDGARVKQNINSAITYFVGNIYEKMGSSVTKYYYAGATRVAMRWGANLYYLLTDHLGSTTVTTDVNGYALDEVKYTPWGEVRAGSAPTNYTFTGQYSNTSDFGLMYYNARWMDPDLGRFASADSIVPAGLQGYDRYAYVFNSPVIFTDPTGNNRDCGIADSYCAVKEYTPGELISQYGHRGLWASDESLSYRIDQYLRRHPGYDPSKDTGMDQTYSRSTFDRLRQKYWEERARAAGLCDGYCLDVGSYLRRYYDKGERGLTYTVWDGSKLDWEHIALDAASIPLGLVGMGAFPRAAARWRTIIQGAGGAASVTSVYSAWEEGDQLGTALAVLGAAPMVGPFASTVQLGRDLNAYTEVDYLPPIPR